MELPNRSSVIDMNEPWTLSAYKQMLLFQNNNRHPSLVFENPSHAQQDVLQSLAHREDLGLEYEYNLVARMAFISRPLPETERHLPELHDNSYLQAPITLDSLDLAISTSNVKPPPFLAHTEPMTFDEDLFFPQSSARSNIDFRDYSPLSNVIEMPEHSMLEDYIHDQPSYTPLMEDQSNSMETVLFCDTPHNNYLSQLDLRSRAGSINSQGRGRVGKMLSRVSSSKSTAGSMFSCFDSKSAQSIVTNTSASSRRSRKSMDSIAKAAMKAVKAVGACWRCKLLKKKCDNHHRCKECPKDLSKSDWKLLGCKRGLLEDNVDPVLLCPGLPGYIPESYEARTNDRDRAVNINKQSQIRMIARNHDTKPENSTKFIGSLESFLQAVDIALSDSNRISTPYAVFIRSQRNITLQSLDECVKSIIWELYSSVGLQKILGGFTNMDKLTVLLRSASLYQAKTEDDQLVAQSLICFRECLEVLSLQQGKHLDGFSHLSCTRRLDSTVCSITSMANLEASISQYIKEFSRVLFHKERMRNPKRWWLSVFYSLCIQNFVRQALLRLHINVRTGEASESKSPGAHQYLHLPLRLFLAYSKNCDPLTELPRDGGATFTEKDEMFNNDITIARLAVGYSSWVSVDISSSKDYLNLQFEDEGHKLH